MAERADAQQLFAHNTSANIADALAARVKDPLWFLARQWQTGEFEAENGGRAAVLSIVASELPIDTLLRGDERTALAPGDLLEPAVEAEDGDGASSVWRSAALEYGFGVAGDGTTLVATGYRGRHLDWYHFDLRERGEPARAPTTAETRVVPTSLTVRGAPQARWWRFEDGDAYFDSPADPEPNALSMLLPEFFFLDGNNWYIAPLLQTAGTMRHVEALRVVDSFGVASDIGPSTGAGDADWAMFVLDPVADGVAAGGGGAFLYVPNVAIEVLDNDDVEEVVFARDEEANLVWASERLVTLDDGTQVRNGDAAGNSPTEPPSDDPRPRYRLLSEVPPHFVPYVPRFLKASPATSGETYLRRARTVEDADAPQYRSRVVAESWRLDEAEVPRAGVRVRRTRRFARGSDGTEYFWIGRQVQTAPRGSAPVLRADYLEERSD